MGAPPNWITNDNLSVCNALNYPKLGCSYQSAKYMDYWSGKKYINSRNWFKRNSLNFVLELHSQPLYYKYKVSL